MKRYLKLVNFEFNRIAKLFGVLLAIIVVSQITGVIMQSRRYLRDATLMMQEKKMSLTQFIGEFGHLSMMDIMNSYWFMVPIVLSISAVAIYIFIIWYRDWFGKNTFIYRLLMLPTARLNVFWAKLTTIMLITLGFVGLQLILMPVEGLILKWMVPIDFRLDMALPGILMNVREFLILTPYYFEDFLINYGGGLLAVTVVFTAVILERCFRWKGIVAGFIYGVAMVFVFLAPILMQEIFLGVDFFYPIELIGLEMLMGMIVFIVSVLLSGWLLKNKIRV